MKNTLYRDEQHKTIAGVCAGLANYFDVDVSLARVIFILISLAGGCGALIYIVLWIVVPASPYNTSPYGDSFDAPVTPAPYVAKRGTSSVGIVAGATLIVIGGFLLLDEFDFIPDIEFHKFWPVILIAIGLVFILGYWKKHPNEPKHPTETWKNTDDTLTTDNTQNR